MEDDTAAAMAAAMGFSSFGAQNPSSKKRKYNSNSDAVVSIDHDHGTGANSAPVGERRAPPANTDEIALDDDDGHNADDTSDTAALGAAASASADASSGLQRELGTGIAGLPQRPAPRHGDFAGNPHRRGGESRQASGGRHDINKLWYMDYYDHFSNENPWAKLEEGAGLKPISTWAPVHINREEAHQAQAA